LGREVRRAARALGRETLLQFHHDPLHDDHGCAAKIRSADAP
jgi:hypothetical protein